MSKVFKSYRKESRANWGIETEGNQPICDDQLKLGALLRIADAAELMAKNHQILIDARDRYKRWYEEEWETTKRLARRISGLQGHITRLKKTRGKNE